jgi:hypothetical protein
MPETTTGEVVYSEPTALRRELQTTPDDLGMVDNEPPDSGSVEDWDTLLDTLQVAAKAWIDRFCERDFERHDGATVTLSVGPEESRVLRLPAPVRAVREVRVEGETIDNESFEFEESGSLVRTGRHRPVAVSPGVVNRTQPEAAWPPGYNNVEVELDYGPVEPPAEVAAVERALVSNVLAGLAERRAETVVTTDNFEMDIGVTGAATDELRSALTRYRRMGVFN